MVERISGIKTFNVLNERMKERALTKSANDIINYSHSTSSEYYFSIVCHCIETRQSQFCNNLLVTLLSFMYQKRFRAFIVVRSKLSKKR